MTRVRSSARGAALTGGALLLGVLAVAWWARAHAGGGPEGPPALDPEQVERGRVVYRAHCASCHGARAEGAADWRRRKPDGSFPPPPHDASGHTWHHADGVLYRIVRDGGGQYEGSTFRSAMPPFGDRLSPAEIVAVIAYLKSLWPPEQRAFQAQVSGADPFPPSPTPGGTS